MNHKVLENLIDKPLLPFPIPRFNQIPLKFSQSGVVLFLLAAFLLCFMFDHMYITSIANKKGNYIKRTRKFLSCLEHTYQMKCELKRQKQQTERTKKM